MICVLITSNFDSCLTLIFFLSYSENFKVDRLDETSETGIGDNSLK